MNAAKNVGEVHDNDHVLGSDDAPITLIEYGDFECPHCGRAYPIVHEVINKMGNNLRFVYRHFPLQEQHPHALHAAEAAESAGAQAKFWEMHDQLFEHQDALEDEDLVRYAAAVGVDEERVRAELDKGTYEENVRSDFMSGVRGGVNGTPTFFINGDRFDGDWSDASAFERALRGSAA
jgi:formate-nitrite transporter family protein